MAILIGTAAGDTLTGGAGADLIFGEGGNDRLTGGAGRDTISGGDGADVLVGGRGADRLHGGAGSDLFLYGDWRDVIGDVIVDFGIGDRINIAALGLAFAAQGFSGAAAEFQIEADPYAAGRFWLQVDADGDGDADATLTIRMAVAGAAPAVTAAGLVTVVLPQTLTGGLGADSLTGREAQDRLIGLGGNDTLTGGAGNDRLEGGEGNDLLRPGAGRDTILGGAGADRIVFDSPAAIEDKLIADFAAEDRLDFSALPYLRLIGEAAFTGRPGEMRVQRSTVPSLLQIDLDGDGAADATMTIPGVAALEPEAPGSRVLRLATDRTIDGTAAGQTILGGFGNDSISGLGGNDRLEGGGGFDTLLGGEGGDVLLGGSGNDSLDGGAAGDVLVGGEGNDTLAGGAGADIFRYLAAEELGRFLRDEQILDIARGDRIDLAAIPGLVWIGNAAFSGIPGEMRMFGTSSLELDLDGDGALDRQIFFPNGAVLEPLTAGSRVLVSVGGFDTTLSAGNDSFLGSVVADTIRGGGGDDSITGNGGSDRLEGGPGNDTLVADGSDTLLGGPGADLVDMTGSNNWFLVLGFGDLGFGATADSITGWSQLDRIDLSALDWNPSPGDSSFSWRTATSTFTAAGQILVSGGTLYINVDWDGIGAAASEAEYMIHGLIGSTLTSQVIL
jgi:Ca2+-binding RTX toxin-like protein